jgi:hypothetical protein
MIDTEGPYYYVVFQSPGPKWVAGTPYSEQPVIMNHADYVSSLHDKGLVVLSGPFMTKKPQWPARRRRFSRSSRSTRSLKLPSSARKTPRSVRSVERRNQDPLGAVPLNAP